MKKEWEIGKFFIFSTIVTAICSVVLLFLVAVTTTTINDYRGFLSGCRQARQAVADNQRESTDHAREIEKLNQDHASELAALQQKLDFRQRNLGAKDPVTQNVYEVIHGFRQLRDLIGKDGECYIKVTAPADTLDIANAFAQLAMAASGCKLDSPRAFNGDINEEKAAMTGSVDGRVLIYAAKGSKVWGPLGSVKGGVKPVHSGGVSVDQGIS